MHHLHINEVPCINCIGILSKSRGQVLRVAVIFHILFGIFRDNDGNNDVNGDDNNEDIEKANGDGNTDDDNEEIDKANEEDGIKENDNIKINEEDIQAAINFVKTSIQHSLYISGRSQLSDEVQCAGETSYTCRTVETPLFRRGWGSSLVLPWPSCKSKTKKR